MKTSRNERKSVKRSPGKPKKHDRRPVSGNDHPAPFGSALWEHYETIQKMRLARKSWPTIALHLQVHGVSISHTAVYNFFKRATRILREGKLPLGFKDPRSSATQPVPDASVQPAAEVTFPQDDPLLRPEESQQAAPLSINERKRLRIL